MESARRMTDPDIEAGRCTDDAPPAVERSYVEDYDESKIDSGRMTDQRNAEEAGMDDHRTDAAPAGDRDDKRDGDDEAKKRTRRTSGESLVRFFAEVGVVKTELEQMKQRMKRLQESGGDEDDEGIWEEVMSNARKIKIQLDSLDAANQENRAIPGCEAGSSTDRTRVSITDSLRSEASAIVSFAASQTPTSMISHNTPVPPNLRSLAELQLIFLADFPPPSSVAEHHAPHLTSVAEVPPSTAVQPPLLKPLNIGSCKCKSIAVLIFLLIVLAILVPVLLVKL